MSSLRHRAALLALGALAACTAPTDASQSAQPVISRLPRALTGDEQAAAAATTDFGLNLFREVNARTARDANLTLSPVSASLALGMLMAGTEGETFEQIRSTLTFGTRTGSAINDAYRTLVPLLTTIDPSVKMQFANSAWFDPSAPPSAMFTQTLQTAFAAKTTVAPFGAPATVNSVNDWVSANTNGRIPKIVDNLDNLIAALINATYFKGNWRAQFDKGATRTAPFYVTPTAALQVPTMFTEKGRARVGYSTNGTLIAELPYGGDAFVMDIVMPSAGTLEAMTDSLTPARWRALLATLPDSAATTRVQLPKFRLEMSRDLIPALRTLGMTRAFGTAAQLGPMFANAGTSATVSKVLQRVFVDVNEEGTEAAAVTFIGIALTSAGPPAAIIDRPFLFVIRERLTGTILFMGKVVRPQTS